MCYEYEKGGNNVKWFRNRRWILPILLAVTLIATMVTGCDTPDDPWEDAIYFREIYGWDTTLVDWVRLPGAGGAGGLWEVDGAETQLILGDAIDMQTHKIINVVDPANNQDAATKKYVDDEIDTDVATHAALDTGVHGAGGDVLATDADIATHAADTSTHGVTGAIVGTTDTQTLSNKTWSSDVDFDEHTAVALVCDNGATVPASATAGQWFLHTPTGRNVLMQYDGSNWGSIISLGTMTMYVDSTDGTDAMDYGGTVNSGAFATISYAFGQIPPQYGGSVIINVNGETYRETVTIQGKAATGAYTITFQGTLTTVVASQSVTSATANTLTKTGAGWGVNAYQNKLCRVTKGGSVIYLWIRSNTATVLTLAGQWRTTVDNTWDFEILDRGTIISGADVGAPTTPVRSYALYIVGNQQSIYIRDIAVEYTTSNGIRVEEGSTASIYECKLDNCGAALRVGTGAICNIRSSYFAGGPHQFVSYGLAGGDIIQSWITRSPGSPYVCLRVSGCASIRIYACLVDSPATVILIDQGGVCQMSPQVLSKNYIENGAVGVYADLNGVGYAVSVQYFSGCTDDYLTARGGQLG